MIIPQTPETPQSTPDTCCSHPKSHPIILLLLAILLITVGIYAGMQLEKRKVNVWVEPPLTEITPEPTKITDPTTTWKTYTNTKYGFQFKYPFEYLLTEKINEIKLSAENKEITYEINSFYYIYEKIKKLTQDQAIRQSLSYIVSEKEYFFGHDKLLKGKDLLIRHYLDSGSNYDEEIIYLKGNNFSLITRIDKDKSPKELIDQILSTFEFTNSQTSLDPATWKTYKNEKYGFNFNYPQDWKLNILSESEISLSNITDDQLINIVVWDVTGFGYCYKYDKTKQIIVGGKTAETADGIGTGETAMCEKSKEIMSKIGNTFVLIPLATNGANKIHISYDYPLNNISQVKSNLNQILSTFKFTDNQTSINSTANWQTYTNQEYGFEFKYPEYLRYSNILWDKNDQIAQGFSEKRQGFGDDIKSPGYGPYTPITFFLTKMEQVGAGSLPYVWLNERSNLLNGDKYLEEVVTINGIKSKKRIGVYKYGKTAPNVGEVIPEFLQNVDVVIPNIQKNIEAHFYYDEFFGVPNNNVISIELFNQVLSTFKFTN